MHEVEPPQSEDPSAQVDAKSGPQSLEASDQSASLRMDGSRTLALKAGRNRAGAGIVQPLMPEQEELRTSFHSTEERSTRRRSPGRPFSSSTDGLGLTWEEGRRRSTRNQEKLGSIAVTNLRRSARNQHQQ